MRLLHPAVYNLQYQDAVRRAQTLASSVRAGTVDNPYGGVSSSGLCDFGRPKQHLAATGRTQSALVLSTGEKITS